VSVLAAPLIATLNHLMNQAEWARARLLPHAGQVAELHLPLVTIRLVVGNTGFLAESSGNEAPDLILTVPAEAAVAAFSNTDSAMKHVRIAGNAEFGEALGFVLRHLDWDAEADLARLFGDIAAPRIHRSMVAVLDLQRDALQRTTDNLRDYLVLERPTLVASASLDQFTADLMALGDDLARLQKRIDKLEGGARS